MCVGIKRAESKFRSPSVQCLSPTFVGYPGVTPLVLALEARNNPSPRAAPEFVSELHRTCYPHIQNGQCNLILPRQWFDVLGRGSANDFLQPEGFLFALRETLRLGPGSLLWAGVPCSRSIGGTYGTCT